MNIYATIPPGKIAALAVLLGLMLNISNAVLLVMGHRTTYFRSSNAKDLPAFASSQLIAGACLCLSAGGLNATYGINQKFDTGNITIPPFYMVACCIALLSLTVGLIMTRSMGFVTVMGFTVLLAFTLALGSTMVFVSYPSDKLALAVNGATALTCLAFAAFIASPLWRRSKRREQRLRY